MNTAASPVSPGSTRERIVAVVLGCGVMLALVVWSAIHFQRSKVPVPPAPERTAAELVRHDGVLVEKAGQYPFTGWLVEHHPAGTLQSRSWISNGILSGVSEGWHTNGVLQIREHFASGFSEGLVTRWRDDGTKLSEGVARAGKLEGPFRRWHANGQLAEEVILKAGEPHGLARAWYLGGGLKSEVQLDGGKIVSQHFWKEGENNPGGLAATTTRTP